MGVLTAQRHTGACKLF